MYDFILSTISTLCFDKWPYMYAGFCPHCDFYFQGIAWTKKRAYRKCQEIDAAHLNYHLHEHHPEDE